MCKLQLCIQFYKNKKQNRGLHHGYQHVNVSYSGLHRIYLFTVVQVVLYDPPKVDHVEGSFDLGLSILKKNSSAQAA